MNYKHATLCNEDVYSCGDNMLTFIFFFFTNIELFQDVIIMSFKLIKLHINKRFSC